MEIARIVVKHVVILYLRNTYILENVSIYTGTCKYSLFCKSLHFGTKSKYILGNVSI